MHSPAPAKTSPIQWLIALFFFLFASLLVFSLLFKTKKDFLMMNVDEVPGNPVSVSHPQKWRVGSISDPAWQFLGDTTLGIEAEPDKMLYLEIESSEAQLQLNSP